MGFPIARNLARAGHEVHAWNRTAQKARPLTEDGAVVAATPADAARGAEAVLTMLADADAVVAAMDGEDGALGATDRGALWLQMSTIGIAGTERCAALAAEHGVELVDAPVLGTRQPAERGELIVLASGPDHVRDRVAPIFDVIARRTLWVGEAGAGSRLKIVTNTWIVAIVEGAAESIALAEALDLDPRLFLDAVSGTTLDLPYLHLKGRAMIERDFTPSFRLALAAKDARLALEAAERHGVELPLVRAVEQQMRTTAREHGDEDIAATYWGSAPRGAQPSDVDARASG